MRLSPALLFAAVTLFGCRAEPAREAEVAVHAAPADAQAIAVAERVIERLGGREAWERTRCISWRFFGKRLHVWDKWTGDLRLENKDRIVLVNLNDGTGRVFDSGTELDPPARDGVLTEARAMWINDSYWMFMPYKLFDPGVRLAHEGIEALADGREADVLSLTFENVGLTPDNRYRVFVGRDTSLVEAWTWFENAADAEPKFTLPWSGWKRFGEIWLATDHGEPVDWEIAVHGELPRSIFESPEPIRL